MKLDEIDDVIAANAKRWWHSFTIWFGNAAAVSGAALQELSKNTEDIRNALGQYGGAVVSAIGVAVILLRLKTRTGVAVKKPKASDGD